MKSALPLTKALAAAIKHRSPQEIFAFLGEVLTEKELELVEKRLSISILLEQNLSYSQIQKQLKVSAATVASVSQQRKNVQYQRLMQSLQKELTRFKWLKKHFPERKK